MYMVFLYLPPGASLGLEKHPDATQYFQVLQGSGTARIGDKTDAIQLNSMFFIPKDTYHDITAAPGVEPLRLLTIYSKRDHATE
jgi:mannose-6-phosphate isomerase-like protein (cupin superfamily)